MLFHKDVRSKYSKCERKQISLLELQLQESNTGIASFLIKIDSCEFEISVISKEEASLKFAFALSSAELLDHNLAKPRSFSLTERGWEHEYRAFLDYEGKPFTVLWRIIQISGDRGLDNVEDSNDSS